jgi:copper chaperone CopZ
MPKTTSQLSTTGMHCGSCAMLIDMTVGDLDGVESVSTEYATGVTAVTYDSDTLSLDGIIKAIRSVGYDAELAS